MTINDTLNQAVSDLQDVQTQLQSTALIAAVPETKAYFKARMQQIADELTAAIPEVDSIGL